MISLDEFAQRAQGGDELAHLLLLLSVDRDLQKMAERTTKYLRQVLHGHPVYGDLSTQRLKATAEDLFLAVLDEWDPDKPWTFRQWWDGNGYKILLRQLLLRIEHTDPKLCGLLDHRSFRWRGLFEAPFTIDETQMTSTPKPDFAVPLPPRARLWRQACWVAWQSDELPDDEWKDLLSDEEAQLLAVFQGNGSVQETAEHFGLSPDWTRRKIKRAIAKAERAIREHIDERLGVTTNANRDGFSQ